MYHSGNKSNALLVEQIIYRNKLFEFFIGLENKIVSPYASIPTDTEFIFISWVEFVETNKDEYLWDKFKTTVIKISEDKDMCWFSVYYLFDFLSYSQKKNMTIIKNQEFIDQVMQNIANNKMHLQNDFRWIGDEQNQYSIWDYLKKLIDFKIFNSNYKFNFYIDGLD